MAVHTLPHLESKLCICFVLRQVYLTESVYSCKDSQIFITHNVSAMEGGKKRGLPWQRTAPPPPRRMRFCWAVMGPLLNSQVRIKTIVLHFNSNALDMMFIHLLSLDFSLFLLNSRDRLDSSPNKCVCLENIALIFSVHRYLCLFIDAAGMFQLSPEKQTLTGSQLLFICFRELRVLAHHTSLLNTSA